MKKIFKLTKTKVIGAIAALVLIAPAMSLAGLSPVLDSVNLYQISNVSDSATWGKTAKADPGETLTFMIHVHNGVYDTTLNNVRVRAYLPAGEVTSYTSRAIVSADNAAAVSGDVNFTLSNLAKLEYVTGSTKLYNHDNQLVGSLPDGVTAGGVSVGNINGCWEFEKWVIFKAKVVAKEKPTEEKCNIISRIYEDANGNGKHDEGEAWLENWSAQLSGNGITREYQTDANGQVTFSDLKEGIYKASEILEPGWKNTTPLSVSASCAASRDGYAEFGNQQIPGEVITQGVTTENLPVSGPVEAMAGIFGTIGIGGASYLYQKSRKNLKDSYKKL
jgi:hypothetical protein